MEPIRQATVVVLDDPSQVAEARRATRAACARLELTEEDTSRAELIAVELANNVLQHARFNPEAAARHRPILPGRLCISSDPWGTRVQLLAMDQGPGMANVERCLEDGFSTRSTPGFGLGAVKRRSDQAEIFSALGYGTVVSAMVGSVRPDDGTPLRSEERGADAAAVLSTAVQGETVNGDDWAIVRGEQRDLYMVVDGLGHGVHAANAARLARERFLAAISRDPEISLVRIVEGLHEPMRQTRGAAIAILAVERRNGQETGHVVCCGIGNIGGSLQIPSGGGTQSFPSHNGTIGHQMRRVQEFAYTYTGEALLLLHSDGLSTHRKLSDYGDLDTRSPATIAGVLYRDTLRGRDDATIMVVRLDGPAVHLNKEM